jgi:PAS domain S-box-containing protein
LDRPLRHLVDFAADAVFGIDLAGTIVCWNAAAEALFGYSKAEVLLKPCAILLEGRELCGSRVCKENCKIINSVVQDEKVPCFDAEVNTRNRGRIRVNISILPYIDEITAKHVILHVCRDQTRTQAKEQLIQQIANMCATIQHPAEPRRENTVSPLTEQEQKVLRLLSRNSDPKAIATELKISPRTLRNHISKVNRKLGTHSRLESVMHAVHGDLL